MAGKGSAPRPTDLIRYRENFDQIFRRSDPAHSLIPGTYRDYRSDCCGAEVYQRDGTQACSQCFLFCIPRLTNAG